MSKKSIKRITLEPKLKQFMEYLRSKGINTTKFTKELWVDTPEYKEFDENYDNIKTWVKDEILL